MIVVQYLVLHVLLVIVLFFFAKRITNASVKKYWKYAAIPILVFVVVEGMRWGRNVDWIVYHDAVYSEHLRGNWTEHEPLFQLIWHSFAVVGAPYWIVISFCSFLLIYSVFYFFREYKNVAVIGLPFMVLMFINSAENLIRWYMAYSFLLIGMSHYLRGDKLRGALFALYCVMVHIGMVLILPVIYIIFRSKRIYAKPWLAISICTIVIFLFEAQFMANFAFLFNLFTGYERFDHYADNPEEWLTGEASLGQNEGKVPLMKLISSIPLFVYIIVGYNLMKDNVTNIRIYNLMLLGILLKIVATGLELFGRYAEITEPFLCIVAAYSLLYLSKRLNTFKNIVFFVLGWTYILIKIYVYCQPMEYQQQMHFVWDEQIYPSALMRYYNN